MNHPSGVICEPVEDGKATRFTEVVCTDLRFDFFLLQKNQP